MKKDILISIPKLGTSIISSEEINPYKVVEQVKSVWKNAATSAENTFGSYEISKILPIHNFSGIKDLEQIERMRQKIVSGEEITEKDGLPNIKLIIAPNGKLLLFDGTHTLLAYFQAAKKLLKEIPYLLLSGGGFRPIGIEEVLYFFPEEERKKVAANWEKYVVNWQAEKGKQLEDRGVNSIGKLAKQLGERNKSSVE